MKAIALISGGLDSILAAKVVQQQAIEVIPVNFIIPFCHHSKGDAVKENKAALLVKNNLGIELRTVDIKEKFLELLAKPRHGFGSHLNPCIDCKIMMLREAKERMRDWGAEFVVTGEVLGQRPMSQNKRALETIEKESGLEGLLLRPLSAAHLLETAPEKRGWVKRGELLDFSGRSRGMQMGLAQKLGIKDYAWPAGGCLLTDPEFAKRLKELIAHNELSLSNIELLKVGRHFRISSKTKLAVGRNEEECKRLENLAQPGDFLFFPLDDAAGATSLGRGIFDEGLVRLSAEITCRYCDLGDKTEIQILYRKPGEAENKSILVSPSPETLLAQLRI